MVCSKCGNNLPDNASFCAMCGTPANAAAQPNMQQAPVQPTMQPTMQAPVQPAMQPNMQAPVQPNMQAPIRIVPAGKNIRYRCEACKNVADVQTDVACPKCGAPAIPGGYIKMYRMGSMYGVALPFGIYIDNEPCGYIGNKQTCWVRVPFGTHRIHIAAAANRNCRDAMITLTPDHPLEACRVRMKRGFWVNSFVVTAANPAELPD